MDDVPLVATYSICACDLDAGQWGVATQSKFLRVLQERRVRAERFPLGNVLFALDGVDAVREREDLVKAALREYQQQVHLIPLHRQMIPWAVRANVKVVHRPDNVVEALWITVGR